MDHKYAEAYSIDNLMSILESSENTPSDFDQEMVEKIVTLARQRADRRGEESALDNGDTECLIVTDWKNFAANEFGYSGGQLNNWVLGVVNVEASYGKGATLFNDVQVVQTDWLETGDNRKAQLKTYVDEEYEAANDGDMWIPNGAQEYITIVALEDELIHGESTVADAM